VRAISIAGPRNSSTPPNARQNRADARGWGLKEIGPPGGRVSAAARSARVASQLLQVTVDFGKFDLFPLISGRELHL
jgi:hypothetical protein